MKKCTVNPNIKNVLKLIIDQCVTKSAQRGLKLLSKMADLSYMTALPTIASEVLDQKGLINKDKKEVNILIHSAIKYDCVDYFRWFALLPFLVKQLDLNVNIVATVDDIDNDTLTQFRNVIDSIIVKELGNRFTSELVQENISTVIEHYGVDHFDVVLNNIPSGTDFSSCEDSLAIKQLIDNGVPYVISDISSFTLLHRYNMYKLAGFSGSGKIHKNINGLNFIKSLDTQYQHCGHYLILDKAPDEISDVTNQLASFNALEKSIVSRLDHGDLMNKVPSKINDEINIFDGVKLNANSGLVELSYLGDNYTICLPEAHKFPQKKEEQSDLDYQSDLAYWGINTYTQIVNELSRKRGKSA